MKKYAFVDVDGTIVAGNLGVALGRRIIFCRDRPPRIRNLARFMTYVVKSVHIALLYPFSFLIPVYTYIQGGATDRYLDLIKSWPADVAEERARDVAYSADIPPAAVSFLKSLLDKGYHVVLLSASPSIVLKYLVRRLGLPLAYVGLDDEHPYPFTARVKAEIIQKEFVDGEPAIVVGNPKREPFWLATERAIVVKSPFELQKITI